MKKFKKMLILVLNKMSSESPIFKPNNKEELLEAVNLLKKKKESH